MAISKKNRRRGRFAIKESRFDDIAFDAVEDYGFEDDGIDLVDDFMDQFNMTSDGLYFDEYDEDSGFSIVDLENEYESNRRYANEGIDEAVPFF
jgi:hypothetical protein